MSNADGEDLDGEALMELGTRWAARLWRSGPPLPSSTSAGRRLPLRTCRGSDGDDGPRRQRIRDCLRDGVAQGHRADQLPPGPDTDASVATRAARRAESGGQGDRAAKDRPDKAENSDRIGDRERVQETERGRSEGRGGADAGFHPSMAQETPRARPWG